jgi:hypothetical protein
MQRKDQPHPERRRGTLDGCAIDRDESDEIQRAARAIVAVVEKPSESSASSTLPP